MAAPFCASRSFRLSRVGGALQHLFHNDIGLPDGEDPLGDEVDPLDMGDGGQIVVIAQVGGDLPAQNPGHQVGTAAAADDFQAVRRHEIHHRPLVVLREPGRAGIQADNLFRNRLDGGDGGVVPGLRM